MAVTVVHHDRVTDLSGASAEGDHLWVPIEDLERSTGWHLKPEGACLGEVCVPLARDGSWVKTGKLDVAAFSRHLGDAVAHDDSGTVWSIAEAASAKRSRLQSGEAPDFELPDLSGRMHKLSDYRGKKVLLYAWASW